MHYFFAKTREISHRYYFELIFRSLRVTCRAILNLRSLLRSTKSNLDLLEPHEKGMQVQEDIGIGS